MPDPVEKYLERYGPALSGEVAAHLIKAGSEAPAARKRVSRAGPNVKRLAGITFPHKARFLYLQQQFGSPSYWSNLTTALISTRSAYGYAIAALRQRNGLVPTAHFPIVCGSPLRQSRHLSPETVYLRLSQAGLLTKVNVSGLGECIALIQGDGHYDVWAEHVRARLLTENILLLAVKDWLRKTGIVSYGKVAIRGDDPAPQVGTFLWDLTAPSYLGPMVRTGKDGTRKNGFVACDVHLGEPMTLAGVAPFVRKCQTLRTLRKVGACLQIFVADRYDSAAFQLLKENGIIPATPASLFGEDVASGLRQLTSVLENAAHSIINADQFDELFEKLGKIEGASIQLRGTLFEYLAAEIARKTISTDIKMNRIFKPSTGPPAKAEADVVAITGHQSITVIECKGYSPRATIPDDLFKRWLQHNVPTCFREIKEHPDWRNLAVKFEFWSTAALSEDALKLFANAKALINADRYSIEVRLGRELYAICQGTHDPSLIAAFEKHFLKVEKPPGDWH